MREIIHRVDGRISQPALDSRELELEIKSDPDNVYAEPLLNVNTFDFEHSNAAQINTLIEQNGINEGIKYSMSIKENGTELEVLDSYLVVNGSGVKFRKDRITGLTTELVGGNDSVSRRSKEITFEQLLADGFFTTDEYVQVPYVNSSLPDYKGAAITTITAFIVLDKLFTMLKEVTKAIADIGGVLSALAGILKILFIVLWIIITLATLIVFMFAVLDQLIQPIKYHAGMRWKRLLEIGCEKLGYSFESTIFEDDFMKDVLILPAKFESIEEKKGIDPFISFGFTVPDETKMNGYYAESFFDLLVITKEYFRAFISVNSDGVLRLEKIGAPSKEPAFRMNPKIKMDEWSTNAEEIIGNYGIRYLQDPTDNNTYQNIGGTSTVAITTRTKSRDPKTELIDGQKIISIPFARASTKTELTGIEKIAERLKKQYLAPASRIVEAVKVANAVAAGISPRIKKILKALSIIGIDIPFVLVSPPAIPTIKIPSSESRIGVMEIEDDFFSISKLLAVNENKSNPRGTKIKPDNGDKINSGYTYSEYHAGQSHAISDEFPAGNQRRIFNALQPHVCKEDLLLVINNNSIFAPNGDRSELESFNHKIYNGNSRIRYRVPYISDPYLKTTVTTL